MQFEKEFDNLIAAKDYEAAQSLLAKTFPEHSNCGFTPISSESDPNTIASKVPEATTGLMGVAFRSAAALDNHLRNHKYFFDQTHDDRPRIVSQGDSWCSLPIFSPCDLSESIAQHLPVFNLATPGDDLADMASDEKLNELLWSIEEFKPDAVLLSGGGNELIGEVEFPKVLCYSAKAENYVLHDALMPKISSAISSLEKVLFQIEMLTHKPKVLLHSYDWPMPSKPKGWLGGPLHDKNIPREEWAATCACIINAFDRALLDLAHEVGPWVTRVDLRGSSMGRAANWHDDIHLSSSGYKIAAARVVNVLKGAS